MAEIYLKSVEKTLILEPREYMLRAFDFGAWTEIRMGMYYSFVSSLGNNLNYVDETVALASALDRIAFGIKDASTGNLPGQTGASFLGLTNETGQGTQASITNHFIHLSSGGNFVAAGTTDTTIIGGTSAQTLTTLNCPNDVTGTTGYNAFVALKLVVNNLGLSSQTVDISGSLTSTVAGSDYSLSALRSLVNAATYGTARNIAWNTGSAAKALPTCWFLRSPFLNNRFRLSAMEMIKIS